MTQAVYLSLGSNLGDRQRNLRAALEALGRQVRVAAISSIYETDPVGVPDQPAFLNLAATVETDLDPEAMLKLVKRIERELGRRPTFRWGPRLVDIDIILYGDRILDRPQLSVPHPEMPNRAFVLVPLAEIAPDVMHPILKRSLADLRESAPGLDRVRLVGPYRASDS